MDFFRILVKLNECHIKNNNQFVTIYFSIYTLLAENFFSTIDFSIQ